jgi:DNA-binding CsgD family transcriptional regulator
VVHGASGWHLGESALGTWELSEGAECARETGQRYSVEMALVQRALARARSGDLAGARGDVESAERGRHPPVPIRAFGSQALASADLLEGRHRAVADRLVSIQHEVWDFGMMNPGVLPVGRDLVESLIALGRLREAEEYQRRYAQLAESADSELGRGHALEMRGRLAAARGERFSDAFGDAIAILATVELPYERARARLALGQELARSGRMREAAEHLDAAAETFADIGADPWVAHAQAGRSAGALRRPRPTPGDGLTPSERRVAELVVDGLTNDDIAGQLFVTRRTVESHLTNVYRKLGIQRRTQLVHALQRGPG